MSKKASKPTKLAQNTLDDASDLALDILDELDNPERAINVVATCLRLLTTSQDAMVKALTESEALNPWPTIERRAVEMDAEALEGADEDDDDDDEDEDEEDDEDQDEPPRRGRRRH